MYKMIVIGRVCTSVAFAIFLITTKDGYFGLRYRYQYGQYCYAGNNVPDRYGDLQVYTSKIDCEKDALLFRE